MTRKLLSQVRLPTYVYEAYDSEGRLLYVGMTANLQGRVDAHAQNKPWWGEVVDLKVATFETKKAALAAERLAIETRHPRYNVTHSASHQPRVKRLIPKANPEATMYTVEAERGARGGWVFQCAEFPGAISESRRLADFEPLMREMIAFVGDVPEDSIEMRLVPKLPGALSADVQAAREAVSELDAAQRRAANLSRKVVRELKDAGLTGADTAAVLGVSPQRVSQLANA
jgi:predicted GIY-YIG superfamily endonuclease